MKKIMLLLCMCLLPMLTGCEERNIPEKMDTITVQLKWVHQAQFAGFYLTQEKGYYKEENLEVSFLEGGTDIDQSERLLSGQAQFAVMPAESLLLKNKLKEMIAIAVIYQRNPTMFVSKSDSGITRPEDMVGRSIAVGELENGGFIEAIVQLRALFKRRNLDINDAAIQPYDPKYEAFIEGEVDITPAYLVGGVMKLRSKGIELNLIWPGDYGIDYYSDTLVTTADYIEKNADIVRRFLKATLRGWRDSIKFQDQAVEATMKYAQIKDRPLQEQMMMNQVALVNTGQRPIGWMEKSVWQNMYDSYLQNDLVEQPVHDIESIYSMRFLNDIYTPQEQ